MSKVPVCGPHQQDAEQHHRAAEQRVEDEHVGRAPPAAGHRSSPQLRDDEPHRDQHDLEEHEEQQQVERDERAEHADLEQQQQRRPARAAGRPRAGSAAGRRRHRNVSSAVSSTSGAEMPSTPRWKRRPRAGHPRRRRSDGVRRGDRRPTPRPRAVATSAEPRRRAGPRGGRRPGRSRSSATHPASGRASSSGSSQLAHVSVTTPTRRSGGRRRAAR